MSGAVEGVALAERLRAAVTYQYMPMSVRRLLSEAEQALTTPPARSYADGIEAAAQIVEHGYRCRTCDAVFIDTPSDTLNGGHPDNGCAFPNWDRLTEESQAAAIRLLSQGGKA